MENLRKNTSICVFYFKKQINKFKNLNINKIIQNHAIYAICEFIIFLKCFDFEYYVIFYYFFNSYIMTKL